ncbi:MAG: FN3 associated domain-containing protein [Saprospiraceae bacterium]
MDILNYLGKFHPIILHLPIGFLLLAFMMELHDRWKNRQQFQAAIGFALFWGMGGAVFAATTGYLLSLDGGYEAELLSWHQWLGFGVAGLSILLYFLHRQTVKKKHSLYFPLFGLTAVILTAAGHYGGSLTHGVDFLSPSAPSKNEKKAIADMDNAVVYADLIQPILKDKCVRCHSTSKTKGDLLMATIAGMQKGGETGALFVKGDTENSLMLQRIHLPLAEKEHMPPKGKQQLLTDEIDLLTWWIKEGADFKAKVKDLPKEEKIATILQKFIVPTEGLATLKIAAVSEAILQKIRAKGIAVYRVAENSPFVEVDLSRKKDIDNNSLKALNPIAQQLISLNLGATTIQDKDLSVLENFPHLQKLFLQQTAITDKGIASIENLEYLEYLNLYQTKVTDKSLPLLNQLQRLKKLYLWQTATTKEGVAKFVNRKPKTIVNTGVNSAIFGDAQLKAPAIIAEKDLFRDSLAVELKMNFNNVNIYYTLDGSEPDSTASLYTQAIILEKTTVLKAIAQKEGWQSSEVISKQFASVKYAPTKVTLQKQPHERYKANGSQSLIDLQKGSTTFTDGLWIGYEKNHLTATLDLGKPETISAITVGALEAPGSYIFYPKGMKVSVSNNGKNYQEVVAKKYPTATKNKPTEVANFTETFKEQTARYIRVTVESNLVNPAWHPAPGAPCWLFIDEISVE